MTPTLEVPFLPLPPRFGTRMPAEARALLESGAVAAWAIDALDHPKASALYPGIRVAIPDPHTAEPIWLEKAEDLRAQEANTPGLLYAALAIQQHAHEAFCVDAMMGAWDHPEDEDTDHARYATLTILPEGYAMGVMNPLDALENALNDLFCDIEALDEDPETPFATGFNTGTLVTLAFAAEDSAHGAVEATARAQRLLASWNRVYPIWTQEEPTLPLVPPSAHSIQLALRTASRP